jgi:uncharacterized membrane protein (DUF4010 family)
LLSTAARDILAPVNFPSNLLGLGVALGIGLLIGSERERRKGLGPLRSAAGVRTFALASLGGALCLILGGELLLVAAVLGAFAFSAISYARSRAADPGLTSEFALVVAVLLGALAIRQPALAAGLGVVTTVLLASRDLLHRWLRDLLTEQEAHDALLFLAAALIILPLTPDRTIGPMGIFEPRKLWELVVLVLAIAGAGHIATRAFGWRYGLPLAGLLGGFVSATATIGSMGASARSDPKLLRPALAGALFANIATVLQMAILLFVISRPLLSRLAWPLVFAAFAALACALAYGLLNSPSSESQPAPPSGRAFQLKSALAFASLTTAVVFLAGLINQRYGATGLLLGTAFTGCVDAHSAAISIANLVAQSKLVADAAVMPILAGLTANTVVKIIVSFSLGGRQFGWRLFPGLLIFALAPWAAVLAKRLPLFAP